MALEAYRKGLEGVCSERTFYLQFSNAIIEKWLLMVENGKSHGLIEEKMATLDVQPFFSGALGFEPRNAGIKTPWLTACRCPNYIR